MRKLKKNRPHRGLVRGFQPCGKVCDSELSSDLRRSKSFAPDGGTALLSCEQHTGRGREFLPAPAGDSGPQCSIPSQTLPWREAKQLTKQPRSFTACKNSNCHAHISYGHITETALACSSHKHQIFHLALGIMVSRESYRVEMKGHHHRRVTGFQSQPQVPPDLCSHCARWCWISLMPSRMRSGDQGWWGELAENRDGFWLMGVQGRE